MSKFEVKKFDEFVNEMDGAGKHVLDTVKDDKDKTTPEEKGGAETKSDMAKKVIEMCSYMESYENAINESDKAELKRLQEACISKLGESYSRTNESNQMMEMISQIKSLQEELAEANEETQTEISERIANLTKDLFEKLGEFSEVLKEAESLKESYDKKDKKGEEDEEDEIDESNFDKFKTFILGLADVSEEMIQKVQEMEQEITAANIKKVDDMEDYISKAMKDFASNVPDMSSMEQMHSAIKELITKHQG